MTTNAERPSGTGSRRHALGLAAALAFGLMGAPCPGAPGDLDPAFGDVGRARIDLPGPAWALALQDADEFLVGGGTYDPAAAVVTGFAGRSSLTGQTDPGTLVNVLEGIQVLDVARRPDGMLVGVGRSIVNNRSAATVFRLLTDGRLDTSFGDSGIVRYAPDERTYNASGVTIDPDDRIVVAGTRDGALIVLALMERGDLDTSFGDAGVFVSSGVRGTSSARIVRTTRGDYRVTGSVGFPTFPGRSPDPISGFPAPPFIACAVIGLRRNGTLESGYGTEGTAAVSSKSSLGDGCRSIALDAEDGLLVTGRRAGRGFTARLNDRGGRGPEISQVPEIMNDATAIAVAEDGSIVIAGIRTGAPGAMIVRLRPDRTLDSLFGNAGVTWLDLPTYQASLPVHDLELLPDGGILLAGGTTGSNGRPGDPAMSPQTIGGPFVARLIGDDGRAGPGVAGVVRTTLVATEQEGQAVVSVRRMGGADGPASVSYATTAHEASAGVDYTTVAGTLEWADGDASDRQIVVPIIGDSAPEHPEFFAVTLADTHGGIGLGTATTLVEIAPDGSPGGLLELELAEATVAEGGTVQVTAHRRYYSAGEVSVTLTATAGTANSQDFNANPIVISWPDGDLGSRVVTVATTQDSQDEPSESFTVEFSKATGGAMVGPQSSVPITIQDNDKSPSGGGGSLNWMCLLLLGMAGLAPRKPRRIGNRPSS